MSARRLLAACALAASLAASATAWARCNRVSITVEGSVEPRVEGALVRLDVQPGGRTGDSVAVWPDTDGRFSASLWYTTSMKGAVAELFGDDCSRKPREMVVSLVAGERTLATARLDADQLARDALGNYRTKRPLTLRGDGRPGSN